MTTYLGKLLILSICVSAFFVIGQTADIAENARSPTTIAPATDPQPSGAVSKTPPPMKPELQLGDEEKELFLKTAKIASRKVLSEGTTSSVRASLTNGEITHDAHIQFINLYKPIFRGAGGTVEKNFRDTYKFNVAAYKLAKLLGIDKMVPMSVEREIDGKPSSTTWWLDNIWMTEAQRRDNKIAVPTTQEWLNQLNTVRVFDQLIYNTDRNQGNLLITPDWNVYMIDHTRAFRTSPTLMKMEALGRCDFDLLKHMRQLNLAVLTKELGPWLRPEEINGLLSRRDVIVKYFESEISTKGEDAVITGMPRKTPSVTIP